MPLSDKELLFNNLSQSHWDTFARATLTLLTRKRKVVPQVFISYAWPHRRYSSFDVEQDIQAWLLGLHARLTQLGVKVLFDIKSMNLGTNIDAFMKEGIACSDKILVIGTETYRTRSEEKKSNGDPTNVAVEVNFIREKVADKGTDCVIPILYSGEFWTALPELGIGGKKLQIIGTDCHDEFLYQKNLSVLIEGLFELKDHQEFQQLKQEYLAALTQIEAQGLSDTRINQFAQNNAAQARLVLQMQNEVVNFAIEKIFKNHPDYQARPLGSLPLSIQALEHLRKKYQQHSAVSSLFGHPISLDKQYINVQMLYQVKEEKKEKEASDKNKEEAAPKDFHDVRMSSFEDIFSKKQAIQISEILLPANQLLKGNQKTSEFNPDKSPKLSLIQGRAGIGKTTFINYGGFAWSLGNLWGEFDWVFALRFRDLREHRFAQAYEQGQVWSLSDWVYQIHFADKFDKAQFHSLWEWVIAPKLNDKVLFLLDGYDEAPTLHPCQQALTDLLNNATAKMITSRPYGLSDLPQDRRELEVVGFVDENVEKYVQLYFGQAQENKAKQIISALKSNASLWGSAHIPVTLNILCGVLEKEHDVNAMMTELETMAGLYAQMELALFVHAYCKTPKDAAKHKDQLKSLDRMNKKALLVDDVYRESREYLSSLALAGFTHEKLIISPEELNRVLREAHVPIIEISAKVNHLLSLGLLKPVLGEGQTHSDPIGYEFLHLTFQEYYAGLALAQKILHAKDENDHSLKTLHAIKFNPRYQIVFWFAAGLLNEYPQAFDRLMKVLDSPIQDDMFGSVKLGLQLRCVHEAWQAAGQTGWLDKIAEKIQANIVTLIDRVNKLFYHTEMILLTTAPYPNWVSLLQISPRWLKADGAYALFTQELVEIHDDMLLRFMAWSKLRSPKTLRLVIEGLHDEGMPGYYEWAVKIKDNMDAVGAMPELLAAIAQSLNEEDELIPALRTIRNLGEVATTPEILKNLVLLSRRSPVKKELQHFVVSAIEELNPTAVGPEILAILMRLFNKVDKSLCEQVGKVLGRLASKGIDITKLEILPILHQWLNDQDKGIQQLAGKIICSLGRPAATSEILATLSLMLNDKDKAIQDIAGNTLGVLGSVDEKLQILVTIARLLSDVDKKVRSLAIDVVIQLGVVAATPEIIAGLEPLLDDEDEGVQHYAAQALIKLKTAIIPLEMILASLIDAMSSPNKHVRISAVEALGELGPQAAKPETLHALVLLMDDKSEHVRKSVVDAIRKLGVTSATPNILKGLVRLLSDTEHDVQYSAGQVIEMFGAAAATPEIFQELIRLLRDGDEDTLDLVVDTVAALGIHAANPEFLKLLTQLLSDTTAYIQILNAEGKNADRITLLPLRAIERIIKKLGVIAATPEIFKTLEQLLASEDHDTQNCAIDIIKQLGPCAATPEILKALEALLYNEKNATNVANTIGMLGSHAATPGILRALLQMLHDKEKDRYKKSLAANAIKDLGVHLGAAAMPDLMAEFTDLLFEQGVNEELASTLIILSRHYYKKLKVHTSLLESQAQKILLALLVGSYYAGDTSGSIVWQQQQQSCAWQGFAGKDRYSLLLTQGQAIWLGCAGRTMIHKLRKCEWSKLIKIFICPIPEIPILLRPIDLQISNTIAPIINNPIYSLPVCTNSSKKIADGITINGLKIVLNLSQVMETKKGAVLQLLEKYAHNNCGPEQVKRNQANEIRSLTFDDESILQDLMEELTQLYVHRSNLENKLGIS